MADIAGEQLSSLMDGECQKQEIDLAVRRLCKDDTLKENWQRYHLIGEAMRNNVPESWADGFAERISAAIAEEAPAAVARVAKPGYAKPVAGLALAASVAAVAVVGVNLNESGPTNPTFVDANNSSATQVAQLETDAARQSRLNTYLVSHNELASLNGVNGFLPYVRMTGYQTRNP